MPKEWIRNNWGMSLMGAVIGGIVVGALLSGFNGLMAGRTQIDENARHILDIVDKVHKIQQLEAEQLTLQKESVRLTYEIKALQEKFGHSEKEVADLRARIRQLEHLRVNDLDGP